MSDSLNMRYLQEKHGILNLKKMINRRLTVHNVQTKISIWRRLKGRSRKKEEKILIDVENVETNRRKVLPSELTNTIQITEQFIVYVLLLLLRYTGRTLGVRLPNLV